MDNLNNLLAGLARAVEMAKPAQEYCFLGINWWPTCMTKAEWSGWMQAIGSVVALAIAIWLAGSPERSERRHTVVKARAFARGLTECVHGMRISIQLDQIGVLIMSMAALHEIIAIGQSIRLELLPKDALQALVNLRANSAQVLIAAKEYQSRPTPENGKEFNAMLGHYASIITKYSDELNKRHNGVRAGDFDTAAAASMGLDGLGSSA